MASKPYNDPTRQSRVVWQKKVINPLKDRSGWKRSASPLLADDRSKSARQGCKKIVLGFVVIAASEVTSPRVVKSSIRG